MTKLLIRFISIPPNPPLKGGLSFMGLSFMGLSFMGAFFYGSFLLWGLYLAL